jgi:hypothetical protein
MPPLLGVLRNGIQRPSGRRRTPCFSLLAPSAFPASPCFSAKIFRPAESERRVWIIDAIQRDRWIFPEAASSERWERSREMQGARERPSPRILCRSTMRKNVAGRARSHRNPHDPGLNHAVISAFPAAPRAHISRSPARHAGLVPGSTAPRTHKPLILWNGGPRNKSGVTKKDDAGISPSLRRGGKADARRRRPSAAPDQALGKHVGAAPPRAHISCSPARHAGLVPASTAPQTRKPLSLWSGAPRSKSGGEEGRCGNLAEPSPGR